MLIKIGNRKITEVKDKQNFVDALRITHMASLYSADSFSFSTNGVYIPVFFNGYINPLK